jgi:predicted Zn-dependent protease
MAASDPSSTPSSRKRSSRQKNRWRLLYVVLVLAAVALIGAGGWSAFKSLRQNRAVDRAQNFLTTGDYTQAAMSATWALQQNPKDAQAMRILAEVYASQGLKEEVAWRGRLVDAQPGNLDHRLKWANAALNHGDIATAEKALAELTAEQKKSAAYHEAAGRLAGMLKQGKALETNLAESVRLDPGNELYQLQLAALRLGSERNETREVAREEIERLATRAGTSRPALHVLIRDALLRGDPARALAFTEKLNALPGANFEDRMRHLRLLRQLNRREFWWCLAQMQAEAGGGDQVPALMSYLNKSGLSSQSIEWSRRLGEETRGKSLVAVALAEAYLMQKDWENLKTQVKFGNWGNLEFQRLALLARVAREEGDAPGASAQWKAAMAATGTRREDLATLARLATTWKWQDEANSVLWQLARGANDQMPALQSLSRNYQLSGNTRELLNVANRMVEIGPENAFAKNNVAYLSLLLDVDKERAHALAKEVYTSDPKNPAFVSTYALALHLLGKSQEGLKLLQALPPQALEVPAHAFSYGVLLAAVNKREEATRYLSLAEKSAIMFAQEKALLAKAREWIAKP